MVGCYEEALQGSSEWLMANAQAKANPNILPTQPVLLSRDRAKGMDGSFA